MTERTSLGGVIGDLVNRLDQARPADLGAVAVTELVRLGIAEEAGIWIVDHGFSLLSDASGHSSPIGVGDGPAGSVAISGVPLLEKGRAYLPLSRRGQVMGVLVVHPATEEVIDDLTPLATTITNALLATLLISDVVDRHQGSGELSLPATIQKRNLPLGAYSDDEVEVGSRLEPAYDVAGDAIDYAINPEGIHLAIFDAVGHGLRSTTLSTLALSTYRLLRRQNASMAETAKAVDEVVAANGRPGDFVTGILAVIRPQENVLELWNAGHHPPLLIRDRSHQFLSTDPPGLPFGLRHDGDGHKSLVSRIGDVIFLYSDGVVQARDPDKAMWGESHLAETAVRKANDGESMSQICREILNEVIDWCADPLADDASIVGMRRVA